MAGCLCPIFSKIIPLSTALRALMYMAPSSALAADDITPFNDLGDVLNCAIVWGERYVF